MHASLSKNPIFPFLSSLSENRNIAEGHIVLPVMLQMNHLLQSGETPTKLKIINNLTPDSHCSHHRLLVSYMERRLDFSARSLKSYNYQQTCGIKASP